MFRGIPKGFLFVAVIGLALRAGSQDLTVRSFVDQNVVAVGQQFTLSVEVSGKKVNNASDPQLPDVQAFASYLGNGSSQNIQFVNGKMSVSKTTNYYFTATAAGKFQIGPVQVAADGKKYETAPVQIEVVQGSVQAPAQSQSPVPQAAAGPADGDVFLRAVANKKEVYQNEPVVIVYKLYTRLNINQIGFVKLPATAGFWSEDFAIPQQPVPTSEVVEGKKYTVFMIKKFAVYPMNAGPKNIEPLVMDCEVQAPRRRSQDPFSDFFDDPFFGGRTERKRIQSNPVIVHVNPLPEDGKPKEFTGLVGQFRIRGSADKTDVKTNEAVSLKITVDGEGNLRSMKEPRVTLPTDFEAYPPKATESINRSGAAISGSKTYEYVLIPRVAGAQKVKTVRLSYFDPAARQYRTVQTQEWEIRVAQGEGTVASIPVGLSKEEVKLLGQDIRFIKTGNAAFRKIGSDMYNRFWFWSVLVLPLLVLGAGVLYRRHEDRLVGDVAYAREKRASRAVRKRFVSARSFLKPESSKTFYAEVAKAMMGFLGDRLNIAEAGMISSDIQQLLKKKRTRAETVAEYFDCLNVCDMKRFSPADADAKEMKSFLDRSEKAVGQLDRELG